VLEAGGLDDPVAQALALQLALDLGQQLDGAAARGVRIDEQQVATVRVDRLTLIGG
jgi:hypothetical protein